MHTRTQNRTTHTHTNEHAKTHKKYTEKHDQQVLPSCITFSFSPLVHTISDSSKRRGLAAARSSVERKELGRASGEARAKRAPSHYNIDQKRECHLLQTLRMIDKTLGNPIQAGMLTVTDCPPGYIVRLHVFFSMFICTCWYSSECSF